MRASPAWLSRMADVAGAKLAHAETAVPGTTHA